MVVRGRVTVNEDGSPLETATPPRGELALSTVVGTSSLTVT